MGWNMLRDSKPVTLAPMLGFVSIFVACFLEHSSFMWFLWPPPFLKTIWIVYNRRHWLPYLWSGACVDREISHSLCGWTKQVLCTEVVTEPAVMYVRSYTKTLTLLSRTNEFVEVHLGILMDSVACLQFQYEISDHFCCHSTINGMDDLSVDGHCLNSRVAGWFRGLDR